MDTLIERRLAEALTAEASTIPPEASARLAGIDYRPRHSRVSAGRLGVMGGAGGVAAAIAAAVVLTSATPAFAGWSPTPAKATPAQLADANSACTPELGAMQPSPDWAPVTTDVDGPYTLLVYGDSNGDYATCLVGTSVLAQVTLVAGPSARQSLSAAANFGPQPTFASRTQNLGDSAGLETLTTDLYTTTSQEHFTLVDGQVAADVTAVTLTLSDGQTVGTSLGGGWLIAWWPCGATASSASVTTPSGTTTVPLG